MDFPKNNCTFPTAIFTTNDGQNVSAADKPYDAHGAMLFTVATVCVYGLSIFAFIAGHLQKRSLNKDEESQISRYLKRTEDIRRQGVQEDVLRLRSQLLASSVMSMTLPNERRMSRVQRARYYRHLQSSTENISISSQSDKPESSDSSTEGTNVCLLPQLVECKSTLPSESESTCSPSSAVKSLEGLATEGDPCSSDTYEELDETEQSEKCRHTEIKRHPSILKQETKSPTSDNGSLGKSPVASNGDKRVSLTRDNSNVSKKVRIVTDSDTNLNSDDV